MDPSGLVVGEVKAISEDLVKTTSQGEINPILPQHPAQVGVLGPIKKGKTNFLQWILTRPEFYGEFFDMVFVWTGTEVEKQGWQEQLEENYGEKQVRVETDMDFSKIKELVDFFGEEVKMITDYVNHRKQVLDIDPDSSETYLTASFLAERPFLKKRDRIPTRPRRVCFVFDDKSKKMGWNSTLSVLMQGTNRHNGVTTFYSAQYFRTQKIDVRANLTQVVLFRDGNAAVKQRMSTELSPVHPAIFLKLYNKILTPTEKRTHPFMYIDYTKPEGEQIWANFDHPVA